jgi:hypothetical protein
MDECGLLARMRADFGGVEHCDTPEMTRPSRQASVVETRAQVNVRENERLRINPSATLAVL